MQEAETADGIEFVGEDVSGVDLEEDGIRLCVCVCACVCVRARVRVCARARACVPACVRVCVRFLFLCFGSPVCLHVRAGVGVGGTCPPVECEWVCARRFGLFCQVYLHLRPHMLTHARTHTYARIARF